MSRKKLSGNRRNKRGMYRQAGFLKIKNTFAFGGEIRNSWYAKTIGEGREFHNQLVQRTQESIENQIQTILNSAKETWTKVGFNEAEIKMLEEAYSLTEVKQRETLTSDRKLAKKLLKQANASLLSRQ